MITLSRPDSMLASSLGFIPLNVRWLRLGQSRQHLLDTLGVVMELSRAPAPRLLGVAPAVLREVRFRVAFLVDPHPDGHIHKKLDQIEPTASGACAAGLG